MMTPSVGRIVHYTLDHGDAQRAAINAGNSVVPGDTLPMIIVKVWPSGEVNGQVFLDGVGTIWVTSVAQGTGQRRWFEPPRV